MLLISNNTAKISFMISLSSSYLFFFFSEKKVLGSDLESLVFSVSSVTNLRRQMILLTCCTLREKREGALEEKGASFGGGF